MNPDPGFSALDLPPALVQALSAAGYIAPLPVQTDVLREGADAKDLVVTAETGSGKTLAYLIPVLAGLLPRQARRGPHALILAPTRELAGQIAAVAQPLTEALHLSQTLVHGGVGFGRQIQDQKDGAQLVIATPGRLRDLLERGDARLGGVDHVVLDEADRMLEMGFVEDVRRLLHATDPDRRTVLCSATLDERVDEFVRKNLDRPRRVDHAGDDGRALPTGLVHRWSEVRMPLKRLLLVHLLRDPSWRAVLVFVKSRFRCHALAGALVDEGVQAAPLHAQLSQSVRTETYERFRDGDLRVLVATDLAERGLDVPDVSHVVNFDPPRTPEGYLHRVGRTARLQGEGEAVSLCAAAEVPHLQMLAKQLGLTIERFEDAEFDYGQRPQGLDPLVDRRPKRRRPGGRTASSGDDGPKRARGWKGDQPAGKAEFWARVRERREKKRRGGPLGRRKGKGGGRKRRGPG